MIEILEAAVRFHDFELDELYRRSFSIIRDGRGIWRPCRAAGACMAIIRRAAMKFISA
jgi:hypothetical protein